MFLLSREAKEELINDDKLFIPLDTGLKKLILCCSEKERLFQSVKDWFQCIQYCDIFHASTLIYDFNERGIITPIHTHVNLQSQNSKTDRKNIVPAELPMFENVFDKNLVSKSDTQNKKNEKPSFNDPFADTFSASITTTTTTKTEKKTINKIVEEGKKTTIGEKGKIIEKSTPSSGSTAEKEKVEEKFKTEKQVSSI
jgi:hypothetical protein